MNSFHLITAVIPAYNEAGSISQVVRAVTPYVTEILVIDDGSEDETGSFAEATGARVVRQISNQGYIAAIKRGFAEASSEIVVTIDADGEFPAEYIPELVKPITDGRADMVQGHRNHIPRLSERFLTWLAQRRAPVGDTGTGLRALRTDLARNLSLRGACICGIISLEVIYKGYRILDVPIECKKVSKHRRVAWFHLKQFFYLLPWLFHRS